MQSSLCSSFTGLSVRTDSVRISSSKRNVAPCRRAVTVKASVVAEPATLSVKSVDGSSAGTAALSLRVADPETSKGLVHRYVVMVRQNMRQVRRLFTWAVKSSPSESVACVAETTSGWRLGVGRRGWMAIGDEQKNGLIFCKF